MVVSRTILSVMEDAGGEMVDSAPGPAVNPLVAAHGAIRTAMPFSRSVSRAESEAAASGDGGW